MRVLHSPTIDGSVAYKRNVCQSWGAVPIEHASPSTCDVSAKGEICQLWAGILVKHAPARVSWIRPISLTSSDDEPVENGGVVGTTSSDYV